MELRLELRVRAFFALAAVGLLLTAAFGVLIAPPVTAAQTIPYKINFQGRLTDSSGNILTDGSYNIKFRIFNASSGGTNQWEEDRVYGASDNRLTVTNGLFNLQFGDLTALSPSLFSGAYPLYLEVELPTPATATCASNGCASFTEGPMTPRQALASSPYAFSADTLDGLDSTAFAQLTQANTFTGANLFAPTAGSTVALTVKASTAGGSNALEVFDSAGTRQAFFDASGNLNVARTIQATSNNAIDLGASGTAFRSGYFGTSVVSPSFTGSGAVTLSSGGAGALSLDSASNTLVIAANDTTLQRTAAGTYTLDLADSSATTFAVTNSNGGAAANLTVEGSVTVGSFAASTSTPVCSNSGVLSTCNANPSAVTLQQAYAAGNTISTTGNDIAYTLNSSQAFTVATAAGATGSTTFSLTDGSNATPPTQLVLIRNNDTNQAVTTGLAVTSAGGGITTAIDASGSGITNALSIGANKILGTTGVIDFSNFDVSGAGAVTAVGVNSGTGLIQGTGGVTVSGAAASINASSNFATSINTGTSTGIVSIGNGAAGAITVQSGAAINLTAGAASTISTAANTLSVTSLNLTVNSSGDVTTAFTQLDGSSTANGASVGSSTSLTLTSAANFDVGNYVRVTSANCGGTGINPCYAKITNKATNTLTITPALTWANSSAVVEFHIPEIGGIDTAQTLANRYGRGYFIAGVATGNGTTYYNEEGISSSLTTYDLLSSSADAVTTLNIGNTSTTTLKLGGAGTTVSVPGNLSVTGTISGGAPATGTSGYLSRSGTTLSPATSGDNFSTSGNISTTGSGTITSAGAITAPTATNTINGLIINSGALTGVTGVTLTSGNITTPGNISTSGSGTITSAGLIQGNAGQTISGGAASINASSNFNTSINTGTSTGAVSIGNGAAGAITVQSGAAINLTAGAASTISTGANTLTVTSSNFSVSSAGAITAATATNTINGLIINSGALTGVTGVTLSSGNITTPGNISTSGSGTITSAGLLQGNAGVTVSGAAVSLNASSNFNTSINTGTSTGTVGIGNSAAGAITIQSGAAVNLTAGAASTISTGSNTLTLTSSNFNVSSAGAITAATSTNTINGAVINGGALSSLTGVTLTSGNITTPGNISTSGSGTITSAGLLQGNAGLTASGAAASINASSNFATNINTGTSTGTVGIGNGAAGAITLQSGAAINLTAGAASTWSTGSNGLTVTSLNFNLNSDGDITSAFTLLNGSSTTNGGSGGIASASMTLTSAANFDIGNYIRIDNNGTNCTTGGPTICYAKITAKSTNTLTISPSLIFSTGRTVTEYHVPEIGGVDLTQGLTARYGRGYFISGVATGNGTTYYNEDAITSSRDVFDLLSSSTDAVTTLRIGNTSTTSLTLGGAGTTISVPGALTVTGALTAPGPTTGASGHLTRSGTTLSPTVGGDSFSTSGNISTTGSGTITSAGAITAPTSTNTINGVVINGGNLSSVGTIGASGAITAATSSNTINGLVINGGALTSVTGVTLTSGNVTTPGNISTSGSGTITSAGLLQGNAGLTVTGAAVSLNASSNFATDINTGTSTGAVSIGNSLAGAITLQSGGAVNVTAAAASTITTGSNTLTVTSSNFSVSSAGAITAATATNTINGLVVSGGNLSSVGTINASGAITAATSSNTINGLIINGGALSGVTGVTLSSGNISTPGNISTTGSGTITSATTVTGVTLNGTTGINTGAGAGTQRLDASGNLLAIANITAAGTIQLNASGSGATTVGNASAGAVSVTSGAALTLQAGATSTWSTSAGDLSLAAAANLNFGNSGGTAINIGTNNAAHTIQIGNTGNTGLQAITIGGAGVNTNTLSLEAGTGAGSLAIGNGGTAHNIQIGTSSSAAQVLTAGSTNASSTVTVQGGASMLSVTNSGVGVGIATANRAFDVAVNNSSISAPAILLEQAGAGDASLELKNSSSTSSFYLGNDASDSNTFKINSYTAATTVAPSTITHVQSTSAAAAPLAGSIAKAFTSNNTAGNFIVAAMVWDSTNTTAVTCSDTRGNTYATALIQNDPTSVDAVAICYATNIAAGANTVTATFGGNAVNRTIAIHEYSGVATSNPVDTSSVNVAVSATGADAITSLAATTNQNGDLIFGAVADNGGGTTITAGTGFNQRIVSGTNFFTQDKTQAAAGSIASTNTFTTASHRYTSWMVAFKASTTGGSLTDTNANAIFSLGQTGQAKFQGSVNSTTAFLINNYTGTALFDADTSNGRIGINKTAPTATLDVNGTLAVSSTITSAGLLQGNAGLTVSGGAVSLNNNSNFATSINTGSSNGTVSIGNTGAGAIGLTSGSTISLQAGGASGVSETLSSTGSVVKTNTNSTSAFQVQTSGGANVLSLDTSGGNANSTITNPSFETNTTGWAQKGSPTSWARDTTQFYNGAASLKIATSGTANQGAQWNIAGGLATSTRYAASFFAKLDSGSAAMTTLTAGYSSDGSTDNTPCAVNTGTITSNGWTRVVCTFTTPASFSSTPYFYIKDSGNTHTFYLDAVLLQTDTNADNNYRDGKVSLQGAITSPVVIQNATNSSAALVVQNTLGSNIFGVDTTDTNLITNPGFAANMTGWAAVGAGTTISRDPSQNWTGTASLNVTTGTVAGAGAKYTTSNVQPTQLALSTTYTLSWYAKLSSGTFTDMIAAYDVDGSGGGAPANCTGINTQTVSTAGWTRFICQIVTTGTTPAADAYLIIMQNGAPGAGRTFWVDDVQLEAGSTASAYGGGSIFLNGTITSPVGFVNKSDSTNAFQIQNATSTSNLFVADTLNNRIGVGTTAAAGRLHVVADAAGTNGLVIQSAASQTADLLQLQTSTGTYLGSIQSDGVLNLGPVAGSNQTLGTSQLGDKLALFTSAAFGDYGFGIQTGTLVGYVGTTSGTFAVRVDPGSGQASSGSNVFSVTGLGVVTSTGDMNVNGGDINTTVTGATTLFNANTTNLSIGGAATTLTVGATTGTLNLRNPTIDTPSATLTLFNTTATSISFGGAATTLNIGNSAGTVTAAGDLAVNGGDISTSSTGTATLFNTNATVLNMGGAATSLALGNTSNAATLLKVATSAAATLSNANLLVVNLEATTALRIGNTTNGIDFSNASGPTFYGNSRPSKFLVLSPEYPGATFSTDGTGTNTGTLTSDNAGSGTSWRNYYDWTSTLGSNQDYTIIVRVTLPADFDTWQTGSCPGSTCGLEVGYQTGLAATTNNGVTVTVNNDTDTPGSAVCTMAEAASTSWTSYGCTEATLNDGAAPEWDAAGETAVLRIKLKANSTASARARAGDIILRYKAKF